MPSVEDEWLIAARDRPLLTMVVYVSERLMAYCETGRATRGKWGILDGKDESGLMSDSELQDGSPACVD
jgi:hypothetical protein